MTQLARSPSARLVSRLLDEPELVTIVQGLDAPVLCKLVEHVGLEDAGDIVSLVTTDQLERIFDDDLWRTEAPGEDATFDAKRFALWLTVLLDAGEDLAVEKIAAMDEDLLTTALSKHILVIDIEAMAAEMAESSPKETTLVEKALEGALYEEIDELRIIGKNPSSWDSVITLLVALDKDHHDLVRRILDRCCALTTDFVEENGGLYDVLTSEEMLDSDVAFDRAERREREGFVAPSDALAFLRLARVTEIGAIIASNEIDPITKSHFRAAPAAPRSAPPPSPKTREILGELRRAGVLPKPRRALLESAKASGGREASRLQRMMIGIRDRTPNLFAERLNELAYLVNVLVAGCSFEGRTMRAIEAADIVSAVCSLGLAAIEGEKDPSLIKAFRVGWCEVGNEEKWTKRHLRFVEKKARSG